MVSGLSSLIRVASGLSSGWWGVCRQGGKWFVRVRSYHQGGKWFIISSEWFTKVVSGWSSEWSAHKVSPNKLKWETRGVRLPMSLSTISSSSSSSTSTCGSGALASACASPFWARQQPQVSHVLQHNNAPRPPLKKKGIIWKHTHILTVGPLPTTHTSILSLKKKTV